MLFLVKNYRVRWNLVVTIGEALKEEREKLGMSKYQFSKGIIDRKFYGEVENKGRNIGSEALVKLLFEHDINIEEFFKKIEDNYISDSNELERKLNFKIDTAVRAHDILTIKECANRIYKIEGESITWLRLKILTAYLEGNLDKIDINTLKKVDRELDKHENLSSDIEAIRLFSNAMVVMDIRRVDYFMGIILNKVETNHMNTSQEERMARLCDNYLHMCYEESFNSNNVERAVDYLTNMKDIHFMIYKIVGRIDYELINKNIGAANQLKEELDILGYGDLIKDKNSSL